MPQCRDHLLSRVCSPHVGYAVRPCREKVPAIRAENGGRWKRRLPQREESLPGAAIPDANDAIRTSGDREPTVGTEADALNGFGMEQRRRDGFALGDVPDTGDFVAARPGQLAVRRKRDPVQRAALVENCRAV